jgi:hypothetical protein
MEKRQEILSGSERAFTDSNVLSNLFHVTIINLYITNYMSVPLGHKNHKSSRGCNEPRAYHKKPGYVYEVEKVSNPILGDVYQLKVLDLNSSARTNAERFIWKTEKWKRNPLLTRTFNKVVPKYNEWGKKYLIFQVGNDGHLYADNGNTLLRVHDYEDFVDSVVIPHGVEKIEKEAFEFVLAHKLILPETVKTVEFGGFYGINNVKEIDFYSNNTFVSDNDYFLRSVVIKVPKGSLDFYKEQLKKSFRVEFEEF